MADITQLLEKGEKVQWQGRPDFKVYGMKYLFFPALIGIPFLLIFLFMLGAPFWYIKRYGTSMPSIFSSVFIVFIIFFVLIAIIPFIAGIILYRNLRYVITNKRVIIQKGIIGRDFESIPFSRITNAEVNVGLTDKLFGKNTGSIYFTTAGTLGAMIQSRGRYPMYKGYNSLLNINDPFTVVKYVKIKG